MRRYTESVAVAISYVTIHNRVDCCQDRLSPFQLWVGTSSADYNTATSTRCGFEGASAGEVSEDLTVPTGLGPFSFWCYGATGQYVTLVLPGSTRTLNIGEMSIYS